MIQNCKNVYRKIKTIGSTPKNININQYNKTINYKISNTNINNNITNFIYPFTPIEKFSKKFIKDTEGTSRNSSDIKFDYSPTSLKDQILSPEDDDLYLNNKNKKYSENNKHIYDDNYLLNYNIDTQRLKKSKNNDKKILILDLDETLVHSSFCPFNCEDENNINPDIFFTIFFNNKYYDVYVLLRPYFHEFLDKMSKIFDIYIFTASIKEYAEPLLIKLDKKNLIKKKLFRDNCTLSEDNKYIKDLNNLNENLKNIILIDNNPNSFRYNKCNGIPIKTWHYEQSDRELIKIIPFLIFLSTVDDVREYIPKIIDNDEIDYNKIDNILSKMNLNENRNNNINIKKYEKKLINIIKKKSSNNNKNKNKNYSHSKIRINYPQLFIKNKSIKENTIQKNLLDDEEETNKIFASSINYNRFEERKNNNYTINDNNNKYCNSPKTINFREPILIGDYSKNILYKSSNILNKTNISTTTRVKKNEKNKCIRSKSTYNFNDDLNDNISNGFASINFNLINNRINNKNRSNTNNSNKIHNIKNYKSYNNNKNLSHNNYMINKNNEKSSIFSENSENYLFTLNYNENFKNFHTKDIININNKSLEQKMSLSNRLVKTKNNNNKIQRNDENNVNNISNNVFKYQKENLFRYKNITSNYKFKENNKNEENDYNMKYSLVNVPNFNTNNIHNSKSKKSKDKKNISGRNNEYVIKRNKNNDKFISSSKTSEFNEYIKNNENYMSNMTNNDYKQLNRSNNIVKINKYSINNNSNINNESTIPKKIRCSTLNSYHINNQPESLKDQIEENKNNTMEISKSIKSRIFNSENHAKNLKGISKKNKNLNNKNKSNINYNIIKQKNNKTKKNSHREINLLNKFMKEFNNNSNKGKNLKEYNESREFKTQREYKNMMNKKYLNYNYDIIPIKKQVNKNEMFNKEKNDKFDEDNLYSDYYRKSKNYKANKSNSNYLRKKVKNINYENNYINLNNNNENENELDKYSNVKNIKYSSLAKLSCKNKLQKYSEINDKRSILMNNESNYLMKLYYPYGN